MSTAMHATKGKAKGKKVAGKGPAPAAWVNCNTGARLLHASNYALVKFALLGLIRFKVLPGQILMYYRDDIEKVARDRIL